MAQATLVPLPQTAAVEARPRLVFARAERPAPTFRFESLVLSEPRSLAKGRGATLALALVLHSILIVAVVVVPLFLYDYVPAPDEAMRAFFVTPGVAAPPPPPLLRLLPARSAPHPGPRRPRIPRRPRSSLPPPRRPRS